MNDAQCTSTHGRVGRRARLLVLVLLMSSLPSSAAIDTAKALDWSEEQRSFWLDGPALLLSEQQREQLLAADEAARQQWIGDFLGRDPLPTTDANELTEGILKRQALVGSEFLSWLDDRAKLLFLRGQPDIRHAVDCDSTFRPIEIWNYGAAEIVGPPDKDGAYSAKVARQLARTGKTFIVYQAKPGEPFRIWVPLDSKRALYGPEMEYWLDQYHELRQFISGRRFDLQICKWARLIDEVTGVDGLIGFQEDRPTTQQLLSLLDPPTDLAAWSREAASTRLDGSKKRLIVEAPETSFPERVGQRILSRLQVTLPVEAAVEAFEDETTEPEFRLNIAGLVELDGAIFDRFRVRYRLPAEGDRVPLILVLDRALRPGSKALYRMRIKDEIGGGESLVSAVVDVPMEPIPVADVERPEEVLIAIGDQVKMTRVPGRDGLILVPPESDVVLGLWRADCLVSGESIVKVRFKVDDTVQMTRSRPPFSAELRLSKYPTEQVIRAEGYDKDDQLVAEDEIVVNQQRGELRVRIIDPPRGRSVSGEVMASAEVVVPEERSVRSVEFRVNDEIQVTREKPPWSAEVEVPEALTDQQLDYLTVIAELDDGTRAEDVRFLNAPNFMENVEVDLVELYTTVTDRSNRIVQGLVEEDFQVFEDGRRQSLARFELVEDLPLTIGITIDTSGSMMQSLGEARSTASDFLTNIVTPRDRSFAVSFSDTPQLVMPRTSDVEAVEQALRQLMAAGSTSLYDAVVTSLYYFRGVKGRRALVLLSDGEDTASSIPFTDALEYAKRSGVAIFTIGLNIGSLQVDTRNKLQKLSKETGGRSFFIDRALELRGVYGEIERELRSQYLLAYTSDRPGAGSEEFRTIEVKVKGRHRARTISGYYP